MVSMFEGLSTRRSGTAVTFEDRRWLEDKLDGLVAGALRKSGRRSGRGVQRLAQALYFDALAVSSKVYTSSSRMREKACAAQSKFLMSAMARAVVIPT